MVIIKAKMLNLYTAWDNKTWLYCVIGLKTALSQAKNYAENQQINTIKLIDISGKETIIKLKKKIIKN